MTRLRFLKRDGTLILQQLCGEGRLDFPPAQPWTPIWGDVPIVEEKPKSVEVTRDMLGDAISRNVERMCSRGNGNSTKDFLAGVCEYLGL